MITHSHIQLCVYLLSKANSGMIKHQYMKTYPHIDFFGEHGISMYPVFVLQSLCMKAV